MQKSNFKLFMNFSALWLYSIPVVVMFIMGSYDTLIMFILGSCDPQPVCSDASDDSSSSSCNYDDCTIEVHHMIT